MNRKDITLLGSFVNKEPYSDGIIYTYDIHKKGLRVWRPEDYIQDAECLLNEIIKKFEIKIEYILRNKLWKFTIYYTPLYHEFIVNKSKCLAICKAVLKLIKESKK
jgi:hypothetical protein